MNAPERQLSNTQVAQTDRNNAMESRLRHRLDELCAEYDKGQQTLQALEGQAANLRATLLRISGAVQVLQEALGEPAAAPAPEHRALPGPPAG